METEFTNDQQDRHITPEFSTHQAAMAYIQDQLGKCSKYYLLVLNKQTATYRVYPYAPDIFLRTLSHLLGSHEIIGYFRPRLPL